MIEHHDSDKCWNYFYTWWHMLKEEGGFKTNGDLALMLLEL